MSATWVLQGIETHGSDLVLSRLVPWGEDGVLTPAAIDCNFPPREGSLNNVLVSDSSTVTFAIADVYQPNFTITLTFAEPVEVWGYRFASPSEAAYPKRHAIGDGTRRQLMVTWPFLGAGVLSTVPEGPTLFVGPYGEWFAHPYLTGKSTYAGAVSADGKKLYALQFYGEGYASTDGGATWVAKPGIGVRFWGSMGMSADGQTLLAISNGGGYPVLSTDGGNTWVDVTGAGSRSWGSCAVSADGQTMLALTSSGYAYTSSTGGATWIARTGPGNRVWSCSAMSADGSTMLVGQVNGSLYLSTDRGVSWATTATTSSAYWQVCAASEDGSLLLAGASSAGTLYRSTNRGATWTSSSPFGAVAIRSITIGADKKTVLVGVSPGFFLSIDGGITWLAQSYAPLGEYGYLTGMNADGTVLLAGGSGMSTSVLTKHPQTLPPRLRHEPPPVLQLSGAEPHAIGSGSFKFQDALRFRDMEIGGVGSIWGTVNKKDTPANVPLKRRVRLYRSDSGQFVRETWSAGDGTYRFDDLSESLEFDVVAWDHERNFRSEIANNLLPKVYTA